MDLKDEFSTANMKRIRQQWQAPVERSATGQVLLTGDGNSRQF